MQKAATTTLFLDDITYPVLNVSHTAQGGSINISAGTNPAQSFSVSQIAVGNTQMLSGPNATFANTLSVPGSASLGVANIANALNVVGPSTLTGNTIVTGSFLTTGSTAIGNILAVGNTTNTPILRANLITTSAFSATGQLSNAYIETTSNLASITAALYLSPTWRVKVISNGGLAFQSLYNGNWVNSQVFQPPGLFGLTTAQLLTPTT